MSGFERYFQSVSVKALVIGGLTLLMLIPLLRVESLIGERQVLQHQAYETIAAGFGGSQTLGAPVLSINTEERSVIQDVVTKKSSETWRSTSPVYVVPSNVRIFNDVKVELRSKGIYSVPVFISKVVITGEFNQDAVTRLLATNTDSRVLRESGVVQLPVSGIKYLRALTRFEVGGQTLHPTSGEIAGFPSLSAPIDLRGVDRTASLPFRLEFEVAGSNSLQFLPLSADTTVVVKVAWPHADFDGAFLPVSHEFGTKGYSASWHVLEINRAIPASWTDNGPTNAALLCTAFGVRLFQPSDIYTKNYRAVRYGVLFIAITFACFFAWEHLVRGLRLHPMQYLLVGLALATFYLLLLALSEHWGFGFSYAVAAAALVTLTTVYVAGATHIRNAALGIGAALAASYGALYVILLSEDYALLFGSLLLFAILATLMLTTRKVDWSNINGAPD